MSEKDTPKLLLCERMEDDVEGRFYVVGLDESAIFDYDVSVRVGPLGFATTLGDLPEALRHAARARVVESVQELNGEAHAGNMARWISEADMVEVFLDDTDWDI
jgi:hypothetical protein